MGGKPMRGEEGELVNAQIAIANTIAPCQKYYYLKVSQYATFARLQNLPKLPSMLK
jgi:hypothetical protein